MEPWTMGSEGAGRVPGEDARHAVHHREGHALNIRAVPAEHHGIGRGVPHDLARPRTEVDAVKNGVVTGFFPADGL